MLCIDTSWSITLRAVFVLQNLLSTRYTNTKINMGRPEVDAPPSYSIAQAGASSSTSAPDNGARMAKLRDIAQRYEIRPDFVVRLRQL